MSDRKTPGVYVLELNNFPNAIVPVATAVPAFIGYTPQAACKGQSCYDKPVKITCLADFQACFMLPEPARQYSPEYYLVAQPQATDASMTIAGRCYAILPDQDTLYYLYNSVRLFYQNGGGDAYIVAVGGYGPASKLPLAMPGQRPVNANVRLGDLLRGLALLKEEQEPTIYLCPDATLLSLADNATLMQAMLLQAESVQTAVCLFDVIGGGEPDLLTDIDDFRSGSGDTGLQYGISYYPFIGTNAMQPGEIDFTNLFGGDVTQLAAFISPPSAPNVAAAQILAQIQRPPTQALPNSQLHAALASASPLYGQLVTRVLERANILPPSGAVAGVYASNDQQNGVWAAPANTGIAGAASLPICLTDDQQANLNVDLSGKSVNAIRLFEGQGVLIWGARTMDGNSLDWRYIAVRRTMIYIEQSIKLAALAYVFAANDAATWSALKSMISSFLEGLWKQGGLQGAAAADAFAVDVGLGTTMTADDLLDGILRVNVRVAVVHPAEFIELAFQQQQAAPE
jgi:phage tail sheath protein FI